MERLFNFNSFLVNLSLSKLFTKKVIHKRGPVFVWGIPIAAFADIQKTPEIISPRMTGSLIIFSTLFMRFTWLCFPFNLPAFLCHVTNFVLQVKKVKFLIQKR